MKRKLAVLVLALMWTGTYSQGIYCESQPPIREGVLEIPLGNYATLICEHETRPNLSNVEWYLEGNLTTSMEQGGHKDLIHTNWQNVPCLFLQNVSQSASCSRYFVIISAAVSNEFNNSDAKACTHLQAQPNEIISPCDERTFIVRITEKGPLPTVTTTVTNPPTDPPTVIGSSTGWMNQLNQWTNILSLSNILNNALQTILLSIVIILIVKRNRQEKEDDQQNNFPLQDTGQVFAHHHDMNDRGDTTDASLSTLFANDSAIDMTQQAQPSGLLNRQIERLTRQNCAVKRQNSQRQE